MKNILFIVGSFRKNSFNHQLASSIEKLLAGNAKISYLEYSNLPFYNQDIELPVPESVSDARRAVQQADGIWIFSPEYNSSFPGVLKNLLDWLSCPADPGNRKSDSVLNGKAVTLSSAAGKSAGLGVRKSLAQLAQAMSMKLVCGEGTGYVLGAQAFQSGELQLSDVDMEMLRVHGEEFLAALG